MNPEFWRIVEDLRKDVTGLVRISKHVAINQVTYELSTAFDIGCDFKHDGQIGRTWTVQTLGL